MAEVDNEAGGEEEESEIPPMQKVAIMFVALGQEAAGEVMKFLSDYEIEEIEGHNFMRGETPESRALRKARDIDKMTLNDEEERIDRFLRKWGFFRVFYRDPYSRSATRYTRERQRLQKSLGIVDS